MVLVLLATFLQSLFSFLNLQNLIGLYAFNNIRRRQMLGREHLLSCLNKEYVCMYVCKTKSTIVFEAALVGERTKLVVTAVCFSEKESVSHSL